MPEPFARRAVASVVLCLAVLSAVTACASTEERFSGPDGDRRFYEARCGFCHVPYLPTDHTPEEWPGIVEDMAGRAGLTRAQERRVLDYLLAASTRRPS